MVLYTQFAHIYRTNVITADEDYFNVHLSYFIALFYTSFQPISIKTDFKSYFPK